MIISFLCFSVHGASSGTPKQLTVQTVSLAAGPGISHWFNIDDSEVDGAQGYVDIVVTDTTSNTVVSHNEIAFGTPEVCECSLASPFSARVLTPLCPCGPCLQHMRLPATTVAATVASNVNADGSVNITLSSPSFAAFVTLTTLAQGRFSDNAFMLPPTTGTVVQFVPFGDADIATLTSSLRVEHAAQYM